VKSRPRSDLLGEAIALLHEEGFAADVSPGGKHLRLTWIANGRPHLMTFAKSPGSRRVHPTAIARLKRLLRVSEKGGDAP
jgi:hypothetical protein